MIIVITKKRYLFSSIALAFLIIIFTPHIARAQYTQYDRQNCVHQTNVQTLIDKYARIINKIIPNQESEPQKNKNEYPENTKNMHWSAFNVTITVSSFTVSVLVLIGFVSYRSGKNRSNPKNINEIWNTDKLGLLWVILAIFLGAASLLGLLLIQDPSGTIVTSSNWTYLFAGIFIIQIASVAMLRLAVDKQSPGYYWSVHME